MYFTKTQKIILIFYLLSILITLTFFVPWAWSMKISNYGVQLHIIKYSSILTPPSESISNEYSILYPHLWLEIFLITIFFLVLFFVFGFNKNNIINFNNKTVNLKSENKDINNNKVVKSENFNSTSENGTVISNEYYLFLENKSRNWLLNEIKRQKFNYPSIFLKYILFNNFGARDYLHLNDKDLRILLSKLHDFNEFLNEKEKLPEKHKKLSFWQQFIHGQWI